MYEIGASDWTDEVSYERDNQEKAEKGSFFAIKNSSVGSGNDLGKTLWFRLPALAVHL